MSAAVRSLVRLTRPADEAALLTAATGGDPAAFAELVRRHGPVVLGVCRRVLGPTADADDAFQATFLALARHARKIRTPAALPGWLHRTAVRAARKIHARKPTPADAAEPAVQSDPLADLSWREVRAALDAELDALPDRLRRPLVLCYLDGRPRDDAAAALGVSRRTLQRRLAAGLGELNRRLTRRGLAGVGLAAAALSGHGLTAAVPAGLADRVTTAFAALPAAGLVSILAGWKAASVLVVLVGLTAAGALLPPAGQPVKAPPPKEEQATAADRSGEPLPDGAVLRLGATHFRHAGVRDFVLLPDGRSVLTAGSDRFLRTWDLATGRQTRAVPIAGLVQSLGSLSPDGKVAAAFAGTNLAVYDTATGRELAAFRFPAKDPHSTFSPDGGTLAVLTSEPRLTLLDWRAKERRELSLPATPVQLDNTFHAIYSPDGKWVVASCGQWEAAYVFDAATGEQKHKLNGHISRTAVTPDGGTLVASRWKRTGPGGSELVTFDLTTGREAAGFDLSSDTYYSLDVSPDGKTVACSLSDSSCLVDLKAGRILHRLPDRPIAAVFSRDGKAVVASTGQQLRVWDAADGQERFADRGNFGGRPVLATSPDGRWLAAGDWLAKGVAVWDLTDGRRARTLPLRGDEGRYVRDLGFTPDGRGLWAGQHNGFVHRWEAGTWRETAAARLATPDPAAVPNLDYLYRCRLSADGTAAVLARNWTPPESTALAVWGSAGGGLAGCRSLPAGQREWAWAADGSVLAVPTRDGLVVADGRNPAATRFTVPGDVANAPVAVSPDGRLVAVRVPPGDAPAAGGVVVAEVATGRPVATVKTGAVDHLGITADNRTLVTAGGERLSVYELATGTERGRRALPSAASGLVLPDAKRAVTSLADGTALVWDLSGRERTKPGTTDPGKLWDALAGPDAAAAFAAGWELADRPADAVPLLRERVKPAAAADAAAVNALVAQLGARDFAEREAAEKALRQLGSAAKPALDAALKGDLSAEQAERVNRIVAAVVKPATLTGDALREVRAVAVLERVGTADARTGLEALAGGLPDARLTQEAKAALSRLAAVKR